MCQGLWVSVSDYREGLKIPYPYPNKGHLALNSNCWKPESETLKVSYGEKLWYGQELNPEQPAF